MANVAYLNPTGVMGNPMNRPGSGVGGVYRNPGGAMGNPVNMPQAGEPQMEAKFGGAAPAVGYAPSPFDQVYADYQKAHDTANAVTMKRRNAALGLVGFSSDYQLSGVGYGPPGANPELIRQRAYGPSQAEIAAATPVPYSPPVEAPVFAGKSVTAGRERVRGAGAHLMNTSTVLNRVKTGTDQDRFSNDMATFRANQDLQRNALEEKRFETGQANEMLDRRLGLLERIEDEGPDAAMLADLVYKASQGNTGGGGVGYSGGGGGGVIWGGNAGAMGYGPKVVGGGGQRGMAGGRGGGPSINPLVADELRAKQRAADYKRAQGAKLLQQKKQTSEVAPVGYSGTDPNAGAGFYTSAPTALGKPAVAYGGGTFGKAGPVKMGDFVWDETRGWIRSRG